jgi:hypothetical protein
MIIMSKGKYDRIDDEAERISQERYHLSYDDLPASIQSELWTYCEASWAEHKQCEADIIRESEVLND